MRMFSALRNSYCAILIISALAITTTSCKKGYLNVDEYIYDMYNLDSVFSDQDRLLQYINGIASYLPNEDRLLTAPWAHFQGASDENFSSFNSANNPGNMFLRGQVTPFMANTIFNNYENWYRGIRKANTVIARIDQTPGLSLLTKRQWLGEMYFFKGYFLYLLLQQYGPVVVPPDNVLDIKASSESLSLERNSYDDCVGYIVKNLEAASNFLPPSKEALSEVFRPTSGTALAVISRVLLVAASPMFNGNPSYSNWKRSDGSLLITNQYDGAKWGKAAAAAKRLIETGRYELYTFPKSTDMDPLAPNVPTTAFPNGAGGIDPYRSYKYSFIGEVPATSNPELIWGTRVDPAGANSMLWLSSPVAFGGVNGLNVTQEMIDAYKMKDGREINNSSAEYPYPDASTSFQPIGAAKNVSDVQLSSNTPKIYNNREVRFYATIGFNHSYWKGTSYTGSVANVKNVELTYYINGSAGRDNNNPDRYNLTGYTAIKYNHHADHMLQTGSILPKIYPIIRYAEILLNYAEALNETEGTYTDSSNITVTRNVSEIEAAINRIRFRAGLPGMSQTELASKESIRDAIKKERRVELAFEGRRYLDLCRWLDAPAIYAQPVTGMNVEASSSERQRFFSRTTIISPLAQRNWSFKMFFWPIPKIVMDKNFKISQNPGW